MTHTDLRAQSYRLPVTGLALLAGVGLLGGGFAFTSGAFPIVRFTGEAITFHVAPHQVRIDALYIYENPYPFPVRQGLWVPLPSGPEPVDLTLHRGSTPIPIRFIAGRYHFELPFEPRERAKVRLRYRQYAPGQNAQYLLRTTRPWRRPLGHGHYIVTENDVRILGSSYPLTRVAADRLEFARTEFMPERDWELRWRLR